MTNLKTKRLVVCAAIMLLFVAIVLPSIAFADRDRGRRQESRYERREDSQNGKFKRNKRKHGKFVNGHDARDGRWDGRGPRRNRSLDRADWQNYEYRKSIRNQRRYYNRSDQYRNDRRSDNNDYDGTYSTSPTREIMGGILGRILSGF